jgi:hypothetical protein
MKKKRKRDLQDKLQKEKENKNKKNDCIKEKKEKRPCVTQLECQFFIFLFADVKLPPTNGMVQVKKLL